MVLRTHSVTFPALTQTSLSPWDSPWSLSQCLVLLSPAFPHFSHTSIHFPNNLFFNNLGNKSPKDPPGSESFYLRVPYIQLALDYKTETNTCFHACKVERFLKGRRVWRRMRRTEEECHFSELRPERLTSQHKYLLTSINHILRWENQKISTSAKPRSCKKGLLSTEQKEMLIKLSREFKRLKGLRGYFIFPTTLSYSEEQISLRGNSACLPNPCIKTWYGKMDFWRKKRISCFSFICWAVIPVCPVFMFYKPISKVSVNIQN